MIISRYCWSQFPANVSLYSCHFSSKEDPQYFTTSLYLLSSYSSKEDEGGGLSHTTTTYTRVSITLSFEEESEGPGGVVGRYSSSNKEEC